MESLRTAGMVQGTPDWQLDRMYENESERMWAEQNRYPDIIACDLIDAKSHLQAAVDESGYALNWIAESAHLLEGTKESDRLYSIYEDVIQIMHEVNGIKKTVDGWLKE